MNILIENGGYHMKNAGDTAMLEVAIRRLKKIFPDAKIHVFTSAPDLLQPLCPECIPAPISGQHIWFSPYLAFIHNLFPGTNKWHISHFEWNLRQKYPILFLRLFQLKSLVFRREQRELDELVNLIRNSDLVVSSGGGYITDSFKHKAIATLGILAVAQALKKPTVMLGHGVGPLENAVLRKKGKMAFPKVKLITLREGQKGLNLLQSLGVNLKQVTVTGDDAIELAYGQRKTTLENGVGVNVRITDYSGIGGGVVDALRETLQEFSREKDAPIVPVPIDFDESTSDIDSIKKVSIGYEKVIEFPAGIVYPKFVAKQAGLCRLVVTASYHAGVFALSQGIPVIGLAKSQYYQDKFNGLSKQFEGGVSVVDLSQDDFPQKLNESLQRAWDAAPNIRGSLLESAEKQMALSHKEYEKIQEII